MSVHDFIDLPLKSEKESKLEVIFFHQILDVVKRLTLDTTDIGWVSQSLPRFSQGYGEGQSGSEIAHRLVQEEVESDAV